MKDTRKLLQGLLLGAYAIVRHSGFLSTPMGRFLFEWAYDIYKKLFEAKEFACLRQYVLPGSIVFDVGANVGFFTKRFAYWTGTKGRVIAIEAESKNFERLCLNLDKVNLTNRVTAINAAAVEKTATLRLKVNPNHPGDHRLSKKGIPVNGVTLDKLFENAEGVISLIKIDVQGAEMRVLQGASKILNKQQPVLFVEVDDEALHQQGTNSMELKRFLDRKGYAAHRFENSEPSSPLTEEAFAQMLDVAGGYMDFLFLPKDAN
jgi:FkbM family methyltransferase